MFTNNTNGSNKLRRCCETTLSHRKLSQQLHTERYKMSAAQPPEPLHRRSYCFWSPHPRWVRAFPIKSRVLLDLSSLRVL